MIEASRLTKRYGPLTALEDASFRIQPGEVVGLLGPNGAGKTTTMRILTGFMPPSSGQVTVSGHDLLESPIQAKKCLGYLPEVPPLYLELTVGEMLQLACGLHGIPKKLRRGKIDQALEKTGTADVRNRLIGNISKGYRQRVGIAQAILHEPPFLILDEPTVGLDPKQVIEVRELIRSLSRSVSILLSSHILQEVSLVCGRVIIIHRGHIVADGSLSDLTHPLQKKRYLVTVNGDPEAARTRLSALPEVEEVQEHASDLESLFLQLTKEADT